MASYLKVLFALLVIPVLLFAALAFYVTLRQPAPHEATGPLLRTIDRPIVWAGDEIRVSLTAGTKALTKREPPKPSFARDVVLCIDISGSMGEGEPGTPLAEAKVSALTFVQALVGPALRVGIVGFNSAPAVRQPVVEALEPLQATIEGLRGSGGTHIGAALQSGWDLLRRAPAASLPVNSRVVVLLSDGIDDPERSIVAARELKAAGVEVYTVAFGYDANLATLERIATSPSHYYSTRDATTLVDTYLEIAGTLVDEVATNISIEEVFNKHLFRLPNPPDTLLSRFDRDSGVIQWQLPVLFDRPIPVHYTAIPTGAGILHPGAGAAVITWVDAADDAIYEDASNEGPPVFVMSWFLIFVALLPAIVYTLYRLLMYLRSLRRPPEVIKERVPLPAYVVPGALRDLPGPRVVRTQPVPTLVVSLGGASRRTLTHVKHVIRQVFGGEVPAAIRLRCLDVARDEYEGERAEGVAILGDSLASDETVTFPVDLSDRIDELHRDPDSAPQHDWLEPSRYRGLGRDGLRLASGSKRYRALAQLALLDHVAADGSDSGIARLLANDLAAIRKTGGSPQVLILASQDGGVGSGWLLRVSHLLRGVLEGAGLPGAPITVLLMADGAPDQPPLEQGNRVALMRELDLCHLVVGHPLSMRYRPAGSNDPLLDSDMTRVPWDRVYSFTRTAGPHARTPWAIGFDPEVADFCSLFLERGSAAMLAGGMAALASDELAERRALGEYTIASAGVHTVCYPATQIIQTLSLRLLQELFGRGMLLDVEKTADGGLQLRTPNGGESAEIRKTLDEWADKEFLEQDAPPFFDEIRAAIRDGAQGNHAANWATSLRVGSNRAAWLAEVKTRWRTYLRLAFDDVLRGGALKGDDPRPVRSGRLPRAWRVARALCKTITAYEESLKAAHDANRLTDDAFKNATNALAAASGPARSLLGDLTSWLSSLVDPMVVGTDAAAEASGEAGLFARWAAELHESQEIRSGQMPEVQGRHYLSDAEGDPEYSDARLFDKHGKPWLLGAEGLLARLWFEVFETSADLGVKLVLMLEERHEITLDDAPAESVDALLRPIVQRIFAPVGNITLGEKVGDASELTDRLCAALMKNAEPLIQLDGKYMEEAEASGRARRALLQYPGGESLPDSPQAKLADALRDGIRQRISPERVFDIVPSDDPHRICYVDLIANFPVGAQLHVCQAERAVAEQGDADLVHHVLRPELRAQAFFASAPTALGRPVVAPRARTRLLVSRPEQLTAFCYLWARKGVNQASRGTQRVWTASHAGVTVGLTDPEPQPSLLDAALQFVFDPRDCNDPQRRLDLDALRTEIRALDVAERVGLMQQVVADLEKTVNRASPKQQRSPAIQVQLAMFLGARMELARLQRKP